MTDFSPHLEQIRTQLERYRKGGMQMFATTSGQSNSVLLLHILSRLAPDIPIYFLNTGYHFPETLEFKAALAQTLGLTIFDLFSSVPRSLQLTGGHFLFAEDPDHCCHINKIAPLEPILLKHDVWINGIRASQSPTRQHMQREQPGAHGILRYHPLLHWDQQLADDYLESHHLPRHPLEAQGYVSVGCRPCTRAPMEDGDTRSGRWVGLNKNECGLHTTLAREDT